MPLQVLQLALSYLDFKDLLAVSSVCKALNVSAYSDVLWKAFYPPWYAINPVSWRLHYIQHLRKPREWCNKFMPFGSMLIVKNFPIPENQCIRVMADAEGNPVFYTGTTTQCVQQVVLGVLPLKEAPQFQGEGRIEGELNIDGVTMDNWGKLIGVGDKNGAVYLIDTLKNRNLNPDSIVGKMATSPTMPNFGNCSWMHNAVSQVRFSKSGRYLFSSSPGLTTGATMWDVETQKALHTYNHHLTGDWEMEPALYGQRSKHEIYSVCPTYDGSQFVTGSYSHFYHWDSRTSEMIKRYEFYNDSRGSYELSQIYFTNQETEILVYGRRPQKIITYSFPSFVPTQKQFDTKNLTEFYAFYMNDGIGFSGDSYGGFYTFNTVAKEYERLSMPVNAYIGSGACDCHINDAGDMVGISFNRINTILIDHSHVALSNPESGYFYTKIVAFSVDDVFKQPKTLLRGGKKCSLQ